MQFELDRWGVIITPETDQDVAFLEDTMGLKEHGDYVKLHRINSSKSTSQFVLETDIEIEKEEALNIPEKSIITHPKVDPSQFKDWGDTPYDEERSKSSNYTLIDIPTIPE